MALTVIATATPLWKDRRIQTIVWRSSGMHRKQLCLISGTIFFGSWWLLKWAPRTATIYQTEIARGSVVLAGLNAGWFKYRTFRSQQMTKMKFSKKLLRKMAEGELGVVSKFVDFGPDLPKLRGR